MSDRALTPSGSVREHQLVGPLRGTDADLLAIGSLRVVAWASFGVTPRGARNGTWLDADDEGSLHWEVRRSGVLLGAARLTVGDAEPRLAHFFAEKRVATLARLVRARSEG